MQKSGSKGVKHALIYKGLCRHGQEIKEVPVLQLPKVAQNTSIYTISCLQRFWLNFDIPGFFLRSTRPKCYNLQNFGSLLSNPLVCVMCISSRKHKPTWFSAFLHCSHKRRQNAKMLQSINILLLSKAWKSFKTCVKTAFSDFRYPQTEWGECSSRRAWATRIRRKATRISHQNERLYWGPGPGKKMLES